MLISAFLIAYRVLGDGDLKDFGLKSLDRILGKYFIDDELYHSEGVRAMLEDYVYIVEALVTAYEVTALVAASEVTGDSAYIDKAEKLMDMCTERFWDSAEGGFFETDSSLIGVRLKGIEDISHPSANSLAIMQLIKLFHITAKEEYVLQAEKALKAFSAKAPVQGIVSGYYCAALDSFFHSLRLDINTSDRKMIDTALFLF
jgi:uncharacterized protein YyaL (SSP411 family)